MKVIFIEIDTPGENIVSFKNNKQLFIRNGKPCITTKAKYQKQMKMIARQLSFTNSEYQIIDVETCQIWLEQLMIAFARLESLPTTILKSFKDKLSDSVNVKKEKKDVIF